MILWLKPFICKYYTYSEVIAMPRKYTSENAPTEAESLEYDVS